MFECLSIWFLFVETKGPTLEEIAHLFDGDNAIVGTKLSVDEKIVEMNADHIEISTK